MKKILLAAVVILASIGYVFVQRTATAAAPITSQAVTDTVTTSTQTSATAVPTQTPVQTTTTVTKPTPAPTPVKSTGQYKDGTYTGSVADAYYGNIQVAAVISGGKLVNVKILQYPSDRRDSIEINQQALPILVREAIAAQSSRVNAVSGASDTSPAFSESLASALADAKA